MSVGTAVAGEETEMGQGTKLPHGGAPIDDEADDDLPVGRVLGRREVLGLFGLTGLAFLTACGGAGTAPLVSTTTIASTTPTPSAVTPTTVASSATATTGVATSAGATATIAATGCVVRPEMTVGPYFVDEKLDRADIRAEPTTGVARDGARLDLTFNVSRLDANNCAALAGATIDIWQCDALGAYSDVAALGTSGQTFLRGYQATDSGGVARFTTIVPGWYRGRAVHIHFKIRTLTAAGQTYEFTSQLFFTDDFADRLFAKAPYASHGARDTRNTGDAIYRNGGDQLLLVPTATPQGYAATFGIGLDLTDAAVGAADTNTGGGGVPGGGGGGRRP